ncbi:HNH endonuclease signature motif containing protein [Lysobacter terrae]
MAVYNTPSDAANTAVRSFLTSVGEHYLGKRFNTASGSGKATWEKIRKDFDDRCAYCSARDTMQIEHLIMFNRAEYGLHHPGNIVPVCKACNKREKNDSARFVSWEAQLAARCGGSATDAFRDRRAKILEHIERYEYPRLSDQEKHAIRVIAESLYENIKGEAEKSLAMYRALDEAFVTRARPQSIEQIRADSNDLEAEKVIA